MKKCKYSIASIFTSFTLISLISTPIAMVISVLLHVVVILMFIKIDNPPHELQAKLIRIYGETKGTTQNYKSVISNDKISKRIAADSDNTGGNDAGNEAIRFYEDLILKEIQAAKYYPEYSQLRKEEGKVIVKFKLRPDGSLSAKPEIIKSCGYLHLNRAALNTVIFAAPFPKFYENIDATEMNFVVTLEYLL